MFIDSKGARAGQSCTDSRMTLTAKARRIWGLDAEDSRLTVSFHRQTESGMCSGVFRSAHFFGLGVLLELGSCEPDFDALSNMLNGMGKDDFRIVVVLCG